MALLACTACAAEAGEIYKSVDANGAVTYSDHAGPATPQSTVVEWQDPRYPPHELHFCWTNCFTLIYDGQAFHRADGADETWTVEKFSADTVVLHRHSVPAQWNGFSADVTYAGHAANDRLVGVTLNGKPTGGIDASWGIALNTLPGNNTERDARFAAGSRGVDPRASAPDPASLDAAADSPVSAGVAPPPLPDEPQPVASQDGYLWTPGYWYLGGNGYDWVPGAWLQPPAVGLLWTPAYWSFADGRYFFHSGYWGSHVGFYGGINYGYGYFGSGYAGGHWIGPAFAYNSTVNHLNPSVIHNTYAQTVAGDTSRSSISYNGGPGGTTAVMTSQERLAAAESHTPAAAAAAAARAGAVMRVVSAPRPARAVTPAQHGNINPKPAVVQASVQPTRPPAETDSHDQPSSRTTAPKSTSVPAPRVARPRALPKP